MKNIVIGFSTANFSNPLTWLIIKLDKVPFSHSYIRYKHQTNQEMVYESSHLNVRTQTYANFKSKSCVLREFEICLPDENADKILHICNRLLLRKYSYKGLIGILLKRIFKTKVNVLGDGDHGFICSEFVAYALKEIGIEFDKDYDLITPKDLYEKIRNIETIKRIV